MSATATSCITLGKHFTLLHHMMHINQLSIVETHGSMERLFDLQFTHCLLSVLKFLSMNLSL